MKDNPCTGEQDAGEWLASLLSQESGSTPVSQENTQGKREKINERTTFVVLSKFTVANGAEMTEKVKNAFKNRLHLVDRVPGFLGMNVISPTEAPDEIWLITYWTDESCFKTWHKSHQFQDSHKGIPKGLKIVAGSPKITTFQFVAS